MRHAVIMAAHKGLNQIILLISHMEYADFYIHVDRKSQELYDGINKWIRKSNHKNVFLVEKRLDVNWSAFSQVNATLELINLVIQSNRHYDYVHFISGQDFPIKTKEEIENIICRYKTPKNNFPNFICCDDIGEYSWRIKQFSFFRESKYNRTFVYKVVDNLLRRFQKNILKIKRNNLANYKLYIGSSWWSLTLDCIKYLYSEATNEKNINDFKYTCCPDEHFFQILIMNSAFKNTVVNNNLRYINFSKGKSSPNYLSIEEVEDAMKTECIFARKLDETVNPKVLKRIVDKFGNTK